MASARPVYIREALRTPIGKFGGAYKKLSAPKIAASVVKKLIENSKSEPPENFVLGHARQAGAGPNPARQTYLLGGGSHEVPCWTVNQACASGMLSVIQGFDQIRFSQADSVWAGGVEAMSQTPYLLTQARWGVRMGPGELLDGMYKDGFHCPMADMLMGQTVENFIASERSITRDRQDDYAFASQQNAAQSLKGELFNNEYAYVTDVTEQVLLNQDEHVRTNLERDKLSSLKAVFAKDGSITAANSSGVTDGASVLTLSPERSGALVEIVDYANVALDPRYMGLGPVPAVTKLLKQQSLKIDDIALFEINEAFAAQALACIDDLQIDPKKVNVRGGVIALGHPIGATGARILTTLSHALSQSCEAGSYGIATLCVSGGMGTAILVRGL